MKKAEVWEASCIYIYGQICSDLIYYVYVVGHERMLILHIRTFFVNN